MAKYRGRAVKLNKPLDYPQQNLKIKSLVFMSKTKQLVILRKLLLVLGVCL